MTTGGEGGAVITDDDALAERMRRIRHHGEGPLEPASGRTTTSNSATTTA